MRIVSNSPSPLPMNGEGQVGMGIIALLLLVLCLLCPLPSHAEPSQDEARAHALFREVRCVACQGQDIADSEAPIAADMRREIREQISLGRTDAEIRADLSGRYGDYVLFRPRLSAGNLVLWVLPPLVLIGGLAVFILMARRKPESRAYSLSDVEQTKLRDILKRED